MQHGRAGVRALLGRGVEASGEVGERAGDALGIGPRLIGRRHEAGLELADGVFPNFGVRGNRVAAQPVERQAAGELRRVVAVGAIALDRLPMCRGRALLRDTVD